MDDTRPTLYLFSGKTTLKSDNLNSIKDFLPTRLDIERRVMMLMELGKSVFEPFDLVLGEQETEEFCKEISLKIHTSPEIFLYQSPSWVNRGMPTNPAIVKIHLSNKLN